MARRFPIAALCVSLCLAAGCGGKDPDRVVEGTTLMVYASLSLEGQHAAEGESIVDGAKLAIADVKGKAGRFDITAAYLDNTIGKPARPSTVQSARNARRAAQDVRSIAFLGDFDSGSTRVSLPIANQAGIVQVSPAATGVDLTRRALGGPIGAPGRYYSTGIRNFARVVPDDAVQAQAAAVLARGFGAKRVAVLGARRAGFSRIVGDAFDQAASAQGVGHAASPRAADAVLVAGEPDDATAAAIRSLAKNGGGPRLIATDALLSDREFLKRLGGAGEGMLVLSPVVPASHLPAAGRSFAHRYRGQFGIAADPYAAYGYEAMALIIDGVRRAGTKGTNRREVIRRVLDTRNRDSILGRYTITGDGDTTLKRLAVYRVRNGRATFDRVIAAPAP